MLIFANKYNMLDPSNKDQNLAKIQVELTTKGHVAFEQTRTDFAKTGAKNKAEIFTMQHFFEHGSPLFRLGDCPL